MKWKPGLPVISFSRSSSALTCTIQQHHCQCYLNVKLKPSCVCSSWIKYWQKWNKHDIVNSWCRHRALDAELVGSAWMSPLAVDSRSWHEHETSVLQPWAKQTCCDADCLQDSFGVPALSSVLETWSDIPWPDWTGCSYWLYLFPAVFISLRSTNGSLWHCLGSHVKYFIVLTSRRKKKTNALCPTQILPNQREVMCS